MFDPPLLDSGASASSVGLVLKKTDDAQLLLCYCYLRSNEVSASSVDNDLTLTRTAKCQVPVNYNSAYQHTLAPRTWIICKVEVSVLPFLNNFISSIF